MLTKYFLPLIACFLLSLAFSCESTKNTTTTTTSSTKADISDCIDNAKVDPSKPCTKEFRPVCGCDRKSYGNRCLAERAGVTRMTEGRCHPCQDATKIGTVVKISNESKPVCGCNGKTYDNADLAKNEGLKSWTPGKCQDITETCVDETKINMDQMCTREYDPVCGCDGSTYSNPCEAEKAGVTRYAQGECHPCQIYEKIGTEPRLPQLVKYVCGCDGRTYDNQTLAKNAGINKWTLGRCEDGQVINDCKDPNAKKQGCPEIYKPVCGCDGITYGNECEAKNAGLRRWTRGECK